MAEFLGDKANSSQILLVKHYFPKKRGFPRTASCQQMDTAEQGSCWSWRCCRSLELWAGHPRSPLQVLLPHHPCGISVAPAAVGCPSLQPWDVVFHLPSAPCCCHLALSQPGHFFLTPLHLQWLHSSGECGALAAAAIPQPSVLQNHLCALLGTVPVPVLHGDKCWFPPSLLPPWGMPSGFAAPPVFSFTPSYFIFLN